MFAARLAVARAVLSAWWVRYGAPPVALLAIYDLFLSQFVPEEWAKKWPKFWMVIDHIAALLPWWGWSLVLAGMLVLASFEYAFRRARSGRAAPLYPKWKYRVDPATGQYQCTLVGNADAEKEIGKSWTDDPHEHGVQVVPLPAELRQDGKLIHLRERADANGNFAHGPAPTVPGLCEANIQIGGAIEGRPRSTSVSLIERISLPAPLIDSKENRECVACRHSDFGLHGLSDNPICLRNRNEIQGIWHTCKDTRADSNLCANGQWFEPRTSKP
jgi:hypothetical protein